MTDSRIRADLSEKGRKLLRLIVSHLHSGRIEAGDPRTYLGYMECCIDLGIGETGQNEPWGRLLQINGLNDLNEWTKRHNLPRITGLIVNQSGDRQYYPGGDYFASNGQEDMDGEWWEKQVRDAAQMEWSSFV